MVRASQRTTTSYQTSRVGFRRWPRICKRMEFSRLMHTQQSFPSDNFSGILPFSIDAWVGFQRQLAATDVIMRLLSKKHGMRFISDQPFHGGGEWPAKRLRKRKGLKVFEIRLLLNPNFLQDNKVFYELREHAMIDCCELYSKVLRHVKVAEYSADQLNDIGMLTRDIEFLITHSR